MPATMIVVNEPTSASNSIYFGKLYYNRGRASLHFYFNAYSRISPTAMPVSGGFKSFVNNLSNNNIKSAIYSTNGNGVGIFAATRFRSIAPGRQQMLNTWVKAIDNSKFKEKLPLTANYSTTKKYIWAVFGTNGMLNEDFSDGASWLYYVKIDFSTIPKVIDNGAELYKKLTSLKAPLSPIPQPSPIVTRPHPQPRPQSAPVGDATILVAYWKSRFESAEDEIKEWRVNANNLQMKISSLNQEIEKQKEELIELETEIEDKQKELIEKNETLAETETKLQEVLSQIEDTKNNSSNIAAEWSKLKVAQSMLEQAQERLAIENTRLITREEGLKTEITDFEQYKQRCYTQMEREYQTIAKSNLVWKITTFALLIALVAAVLVWILW